MGYNSMTQEDVHHLSKLMSVEGESLPSSTSSPTTSESDPSNTRPKSKSDSWNPLRLSFRQRKPRHHVEKHKTGTEFRLMSFWQVIFYGSFLKNILVYADNNRKRYDELCKSV